MSKRVRAGQVRRDPQHREWRVVGSNKRSVEVLPVDAPDGQKPKSLPRSTVLEWPIVE